MIKTLYSIATNIGASGLGTVAKYAIITLHNHNLLKLSVSYKTNIKLQNRHISLYFNPFKPIKIFSKQSYYALKKRYFDILVSHLIDYYDINTIHCWLNQSLFTIKKAKKQKIRVILESGSTHPLYRNELLKREYEKLGLSLEKFDNEYIIKNALTEIELADYILVPSEFAKKTFIINGINPDRVHVIKRGVNITKYNPEMKDIDQINILFAGHIGVRKGVYYLLEAWKKLQNLSNLSLYLMGNIEEEFEDILNRYRDLRNVYFLGFKDEPWHYFNKSHIFIFPTLEEGSAKVVYEAMAAGMCVITTENAGSIIEDKRDGIIIPAMDAEKIYESISCLIENRQLMEYLSLNAQEKVKKYTWEDYQNNLVIFYKDLVNVDNHAGSIS